MGTSSNLAVVDGARSVVLHSSYDGSPENVLPSIAMTVAVLGLDAFREAFAQTRINPEEADDEESEETLNARQAVDRYVAWALSKGRAPEGVEGMLSGFDYGTPSHPDSGLLLLLAPRLYAGSAWSSMDEADFHVDLAAGRLTCRRLQPQGPTGWVPFTALSLDLSSLEGLHPGFLRHKLSETIRALDLDGPDGVWDPQAHAAQQAQNQTILDQALEAVRRFTQDPEAQQAFALEIEAQERATQAQIDEYARSNRRVKPEPVLHRLELGPQDAWPADVAQALCAQAAETRPALARAEVVRTAHAHPTVVLQIEVQPHEHEAQAWLESLGAVVRAWGGSHAQHGVNGGVRTTARSSHAWTGPDDHGVRPGAPETVLPTRTLAQILREALDAGDDTAGQQARARAWSVGWATLDPTLLDAPFAPPSDAAARAQDALPILAPLLILQEGPSALKDRWARLSPSRQEQAREGLGPALAFVLLGPPSRLVPSSSGPRFG